MGEFRAAGQLYEAFFGVLSSQKSKHHNGGVADRGQKSGLPCPFLRILRVACAANHTISPITFQYEQLDHRPCVTCEQKSFLPCFEFWTKMGEEEVMDLLNLAEIRDSVSAIEGDVLLNAIRKRWYLGYGDDCFGSSSVPILRKRWDVDCEDGEFLLQGVLLCCHTPCSSASRKPWRCDNDVTQSRCLQFGDTNLRHPTWYSVHMVTSLQQTQSPFLCSWSHINCNATQFPNVFSKTAGQSKRLLLYYYGMPM